MEESLTALRFRKLKEAFLYVTLGRKTFSEKKKYSLTDLFFPFWPLRLIRLCVVSDSCV
ncbi:MAG: hypothetical protein NTV63_04520 [Candidatus Woesearchaeota archaeon]|nr:hypothetical protein [Candidatus Woesearchaeota archaeon]